MGTFFFFKKSTVAHVVRHPVWLTSSAVLFMCHDMTCCVSLFAFWQWFMALTYLTFYILFTLLFGDCPEDSLHANVFYIACRHVAQEWETKYKVLILDINTMSLFLKASYWFSCTNLTKRSISSGVFQDFVLSLATIKYQIIFVFSALGFS